MAIQGTGSGGVAAGAPSAKVLERNLGALGAGSARAVQRIREAVSRSDVAWVVGADGALSASIGNPARQLASLRGPLAEAEKFAAAVDIAAAACVVVRGFGVGHHVGALARRLKQHGAVIVFEPDVELLRAVLERVDCSEWFKISTVAIVTDSEDGGAIAAAASGIEAVLAAGTVLVDHLPSRARIGEAGERFGLQFTNVMKAVRTNVVTTLVQVDVSVQNLLMNLAWYATAPGIADLQGACKGKPAVVVSAGPSLRRNVELLSRPGVRDRVVIIAVQTVLKTLLSKGIKPHFVTALDYHEISRRFYEGLTAEDVDGVTLVVEPKCSRAILEAYPGRVRCVGDHVLDEVLGGALARRMGEMQPGATVAHLAYYLARHLGCDPVILIGQDLGFTDGQYYAPGAAIHQVWSSELNEFRTLEMMEWERIARMRALLRKVQDVEGRPIYTDEQMATYLVQFERDFMVDAAQGRMTIDATEGGVLKKHTSVMTLHEALERHAKTDECIAPAPPADLGEERLRAVEARLKELRASARKIAKAGRDAEGVLGEMLERQQDVRRVNELIAKVEGLGKIAVAQPAYWLVQYINQTGQFNRYRADRAIHIDPAMPVMEKQKKEIERDIVNVRWLADAAEHVGELLEEAAAGLGRKVLSGGADRGAAKAEARAAAGFAGTEAESKPVSVWAVIAVDAEMGGLGTRRDLSRPFVLGMNPLQMTLARLGQCRGLDGVLLLTADPAGARRLMGTPPKGMKIEVDAVDGEVLRARTRAVGIGRLWSRHCWRGGIANLSCFDESFAPGVIASAMEARGIDAAVVVGADWALVDPVLVDDVIARHRDRPEVNQLTFAQAPPGLGACVISRYAAQELASADSPLATIGGLLGYIPLAPQADPIAKPVCAMVAVSVRDLLVRCVPDSEGRRGSLAEALRGLGTGVLTASAAEIAAAVGGVAGAPSFGVEMVTVEAGVGAGALSGLAGLGEDVALTVVDAGDWRGSAAMAGAAHGAGFAGVHVKTSLGGGVEEARALVASGVDVVSVLLEGTEADTAAIGAVEWMLGKRGEVGLGLNIEPPPPRRLGTPSAGAEGDRGGLPAVWIVPRVTRRDEVYGRIEDFYNHWIMSAGACVIDPLQAAVEGQRIEPLPVPANVAARRAGSTLVIAGDGTVRDGVGTRLGNPNEEGVGSILARSGAGGQSVGSASPMSIAS